ncbi:MAG TPA: AAA family ATPase [Gemmatimonadales bacterium]|jgi:predicted ATPase
MKVYTQQSSVPRAAVLGGGAWQLADLTALTVLFGKNGSGKSLLLRSWRDHNRIGTHYVVPERTGEFNYNANFLKPQLSAEERSQQSQRNFTPEYRSHTLARVQAYFMERGAGRAGAVGTPAPDELERFLSMLLPDFDVKLRSAVPPYRLSRASDGQEIKNVDQLSSGEAQLLSIGIDILTIAAIWELQAGVPRVVLVDEPDAHIHPDLQVRFADFLVQVGDRFELQFVVATHSTTLLAAIGQFGKENTSQIYMDRTKTELHAVPFSEALRELASVLGGHALMGPLFGVPLLLVEGDDDYRIWSQVPRHHITSFAVVPCEGQKIRQYQVSLERVFASLRDDAAMPAGFALLDGDQPLPVGDNPQQRHVRFLRTECREAENLYLTTDVLASLEPGLTWDAGCSRIEAAANQFGDKASRLAAVRSWDRVSDDVKVVISEISKILDPKGVHWTQRVGAAIGKQRPTGELARWLGAGVLDALWGESRPG